MNAVCRSLSFFKGCRYVAFGNLARCKGESVGFRHELDCILIFGHVRANVVDEARFGEEQKRYVRIASQEHWKEDVGLVEIVATQVSFESDLKRHRIDATFIKKAGSGEVHSARTAFVLVLEARKGVSGGVLLDSDKDFGQADSRR